MNALSGAYIPAARPHALPLKAIALFCGLVLGLFLCMATYGLDTPPRAVTCNWKPIASSTLRTVLKFGCVGLPAKAR